MKKRKIVLSLILTLTVILNMGLLTNAYSVDDVSAVKYGAPSAPRLTEPGETRTVSITCEDVTYGETPSPVIECNVPYEETDVTYSYTGETNAGVQYNSPEAPSEAGEYEVTVTLAEVPDQYPAITSDPDEFTIDRAGIEPTLNIANRVYGDKTVRSVSGNTGGGRVKYVYFTDQECRNPTDTVNGAATKGGDPAYIGTYYVYAYVEETNNYSDGYTQKEKFVVSRRTVKVKANNQKKKYGEEDPELTVKITGLVDGDKIIYTVSRKEGENPGTYAITPTGRTEQGNYKVEYIKGQLTIGNKYTLYFDLNGGSLNGKTGTYKITGLEYGEDVVIPGPPERKGYEFVYWKGSEYYPDDIYTVEDSHHFKAVWEKTGSSNNNNNNNSNNNNSNNKNGKNGTTSRSVRTGDTNNLTAWMITLALSVILLACAALIRCKDAGSEQ